MYKALGTAQDLHSLVLDLHFGPRPRPLCYQHSQTMKEALIDATMVETLAVSIWNLVTSSKDHGTQPSRLRNLRLVPFGLHHFPIEESHLLSNLRRSFLIKHYNYNNPGFPNLEEINKETWDIWRENRVRDLAPHEG
ncbi:uncharacterized protein BDV17DRAFT_117479 [Aspergillus undulatus]|uniref:uncharacterized protein n=1 Tax=Aspergillus undulatus TaxID=1810928 RepID=UPI003CCD14CA